MLLVSYYHLPYLSAHVDDVNFCLSWENSESKNGNVLGKDLPVWYSLDYHTCLGINLSWIMSAVCSGQACKYAALDDRLVGVPARNGEQEILT